MSSSIIAQVLGLNFSNNILSAAPPGSLATANNVNVSSAGLLEPRKGFSPYSGYTFGGGTDRATSIGQFGTGSWIVKYGAAGVLGYLYSGGSGDYSGSFLPVSAALARMRFIEAGGNIYLNTSTGTDVVSTITVAPVEAGAPKSVTPTGAYPAFTTGITWFSYNTAVAYRYCVSIKDPAGNVKQGVPSGRSLVRNRIFAPVGSLVRAGNVVTVTLPAGSYHGLTVGDTVTLSPGEATFAAGNYVVTVTPSNEVFKYASIAANSTSTLDQDFEIDRGTNFTVFLPAGVTTSHYVEVFRSEATENSDDEPSDELYKCYERRLSATDVMNLGFSLFDSCPESLLGDPLYTNPSQEGILQANERPPIGRDIAFFQDRLWVANTVSRHRFELDLLGVSAPDGFQNNWTITIADVTATAKTSPGAATDVQIVSNLTAALNTEQTARNLINVINTNSTLVYGYYISTPDDSPGKMLFESRAIGGSAFRVYGATSGAALSASWIPQVPIASSSFSASDNSTVTNGLAYSKLGQPESFPLLNTLTVGPKNCNILRIIGLRDRLYVFTDAGIYTVTPGQEPFSAIKLAEAVCYAADSVVTLGEAVWALTDQGVVRVVETGVTVVSRPIESALLSLYGTSSSGALDAVKRYAFAVGHESARQYVLWLPTAYNSTTCDQAYVYNTATQAWTRWTYAATCGIHDPHLDLLFVGSASANTLYRQRNIRDSTDYYDSGTAVTLNSVSGKALTLASTTGVNVGDRLYGTSSSSLVTVVDSSTVVHVADTIAWTTGSITHNLAIACEAVFNPLTAGHPALVKLFGDLSLCFQRSEMSTASVDFSTDLHTVVATQAITFTGNAPLRRIFPVPNGQCAQMTIGFRVREAGVFWQLAGFAMEYTGGPGKASR